MSARKHIVVVGSGIAGLIAALEISRKHDVTLVTKSELAESNTRWAQGGIAAAMFPDDSVAEHIADTLRAGAGLCNVEAVEVLCNEGPERIRDLMRLGVSFDKRDGELAKGLEAAHSYPRILHAGGDATGLSIELALVHAVRSAANIKVLEHTFACDLTLDAHGRVDGLKILDAQILPRTLRAHAVVLASGGAGQLYRYTTNPGVATGDGMAMALRAGAVLEDMEFYQFHPTALVTNGSTFLISEAVRGDGAVLLDANGRRFMQHIDPAAELAPRDVVARGIARQMAMQDGEPVMLDATHLGKKFLAVRFPTIDAAVRERGFDWSREPIPVTPAAHYWMGGVKTDIWGRTSVPNLFAVGEVACTGVHGANRLASNSLLESLVFAWRCAEFLKEGREHYGMLSPYAEPLPVAVATESSEEPMDRATLQALMWNAAGIERNAVIMRAALEQLQRGNVTKDSIADLETKNLISLASVLIQSALTREESRGAHYRDDFPERSNTLQHSFSFAKLTEVFMLTRPHAESIDGIVVTALMEDAPSGDITTQSIIPRTARVSAELVAREGGVMCGEDVFRAAMSICDAAIVTTFDVHDGARFEAGMRLATVVGPAQPILRAERVALNFTQHLCGIATLTMKYVAKAAGTHARIVDTRKTTPGLRVLERYAVRCGGGHNHRFSLSDAVLVKDNHLAVLASSIPGRAPKSVTESLRDMKAALSHTTHVEVEVDSLEQIEPVLASGIDTILLDNFSISDLHDAVKLIDGRAKIEASGGITLETVREVAQTGVDLISVGALTQNAHALDLGLDFKFV